MNPSLQVDIGADIKNLRAAMQQAQQVVGGFSSSIKAVGASLAAGFSISAIASFTKEVINVTSEFQKFEAVLTTTLGSNSAAKAALLDINEAAKKTPYEVREITAAYVRWANMGLDPTIEKMYKISDVASSLGAGFEQTAEAFKDLMVGQTKRLEEVGIAAEAIRGTNLLKLDFKGVTLQIEKNAEGVQKALDVYSQLNGVIGTSQAISETLGGKISNLSDSWTLLLNTIGQGNNGVLSGAVSLLNQAISKATELLKTDYQKSQDRESKVYSEQLEKAGKVYDVTKDISKAREESLKNLYSELTTIDEALKNVEAEIKKYDDNQNAGILKRKNVTKEQGDIYLANLRQQNDLTNRYNDLVNEGQKAIIEFFDKKEKDLELEKKKTTELARQNALTKDTENTKFLSKLKLDAKEIEPTKNKRGESLGYYGIQGKSEVGMPDFDKLKEYVEKLKSLAESAKPGMIDLSQTIQNAFVGIGDVIGNALAGTEDIGTGLLKLLGGLMKQIGSAMIGTATGLLALQLAIANPFTGGAALLAAGVALVALGSLISSAGKSASAGAGGSGGVGAGRAIDNFKDYERIRATSFDGARLQITGLTGNTLSALIRKSDYQTGLTGG